MNEEFGVDEVKKLSPERQEALISIGVNFNELDERWEQKRQEVIAFKEKHGRLPQSGEPGYEWIRDQKEYFRKGKLSPERQEALTSIGVDFNNLDERWEQKRQKVIAFKNKHGRLPQSGEPGYDWLHNQKGKFKKGKLSPERQEALISIGVTFHSVLDERWEQKRQEVIAFKEKHGRLPQKGEPGYDWLHNQKGKFKKGKLSPERQEALISIGFDFSFQQDKNDAIWEHHRQEVIAFKEKHGRLPKRGEPGFSWIDTQKEKFREGKLSPDRHALLIAIGVKFPDK